MHPMAETHDEQTKDAGGTEGGKDRADGGKGEHHHNYKFLWIGGAVVVVATITILIYHFTVGRYHVTTKDAYVNGNMVRLQPQVTGTVTYIGADQTQSVAVGQILVQLDSKDADVSL